MFTKPEPSLLQGGCIFLGLWMPACKGSVIKENAFTLNHNILKESIHLTGLSTGMRDRMSHTSQSQASWAAQRAHSHQLESGCLKGT